MRRVLILGLACAALAACNKDEEARQPSPGECPALNSQQVASRGLDLGSGASINGVGVSRERGSSSCRVEGAGVACDLTDPGVVSVVPAEGAQAAFFEIPAGRNASITVSGGQAACTLS
jgi:hypothetical protein